jgi:predicted membrane-bound spermidine synthase
MQDSGTTAAPPEPTSPPSAARVEGPIGAVAVAFFFSGASALVYQIAWQRMLGLFGGSDNVSASLVVGAFLLGLGLGSLWASMVADRLGPRQAIAAFAGCEIGIAAFAWSSPFFLYEVLQRWLLPLAGSYALIFAVAFVGMLVPTLLMGLSLPLLSRALAARIETSADRIGFLYALNTLGAGMGAAAAGFFFIGTMGFRTTIGLAAVVNLLVAAVALAVVPRVPSAVASKAAARPRLDRVPAAVWSWCGLVLASGFVIVGLEILWLRIVGVVMEGNVYAFPLVLSVFLAADALGIVAGIFVSRRHRSPRRLFVAMQGWVSLYALASVLALYGLYAHEGFADVFLKMGVISFAWDKIGPLIAVTIALAAPPAFLLGMSFPIVQRAVQLDPDVVGQRVSLVQLFNIVGNAGGSLIVGLAAIHSFGTGGSLVAIGLVGLGFALWHLSIAARQPSRRGWHAAAAAAAAIAVAIAAFPGNVAFWDRMHGVREGSRAVVAEDRSGLALLRLWGEVGILYVFGHLQSTLPFAPYHVLLGAVGPLLHPDPKSVLVIGSGIGSTPFAAGLDPRTEKIRVVELVDPVYATMRGYVDLGFGLGVDGVLKDPRYEWITGDGRHDLLVRDERYDVIEADALLPKSANSGVLYSEEFFRMIRDRLKSGGYAVQWAPTERTVATFARVFPHVVAIRPMNALIGSTEPFAVDLERLRRRLEEPAIKRTLDAAQVAVSSILRYATDRSTVSPTPDDETDVNTDLFPRDEYYLNERKIDRLF